jgi:hypothetical protein
VIDEVSVSGASTPGLTATHRWKRVPFLTVFTRALPRGKRATLPRSRKTGKEMTMTHAEEILHTHPTGAVVESGALGDCIEACSDCAQSCTACADADLGEDDVATLIRCIRLCEDCSDIYTATERVVSRQTQFEPELARVIVQACAQSCRLCGDECERHADHHEHCRVCAEVCRRCEEACEELLSALAA